MKKTILTLSIFFIQFLYAQSPLTTFEKSTGKQTVTYFDCIKFYQSLSASFGSLKITKKNITDAGLPLHLLIYSADKQFDPSKWHQQGKVVILINNGIHPGEPDGIDASMMLLRDACTGKIKVPSNVILAVIPIYNIGGSLNRTSFSRVNQDGPESYGFRGNAQNLDLNRDFIKCDSRNAIAFTEIFQEVNPDIFLDNHVSDGADYQYTMTLLTTQHNKLGGEIGKFLHDEFEPALYKGMNKKSMLMTPYVNFEDGDTQKGWTAFYDAPRYSSGYAALFQTISFMSETHMLKPFKDRVLSTYALMQTMIEEASKYADKIVATRKASIEAVKNQTAFALSWKADTARFDMINFKGYRGDSIVSAVTGMKKLFYNHEKPFEAPVKFYNYLNAVNITAKARAYIIPQGWHNVTDLLALNGVKMQRLKADTIIGVEVSRIEDYKSYPKPFEKHHRNYDVKLSSSKQTMQFRQGDYIVYTGQAADRYIVETLEPQSDDSFFSWNFFDAVLQQKEGYSDYRWEDVAAKFIETHPEVKQLLDEKKQKDSNFAASAKEQLRFVYTHSPYYEPAHMRYPVYKVN